MRFAAGVIAGIALLILVTLGGCYVGTRYATDDPKELAWWLVHKADKRDYKADVQHQEVMDAIHALGTCLKCGEKPAPVHRTIVRRTKPIVTQAKPDCPPETAPSDERLDRLEGRVDNLEHRVDTVEETQKKLLAKSDEILDAINSPKIHGPIQPQLMFPEPPPAPQPPPPAPPTKKKHCKGDCRS